MTETSRLAGPPGVHCSKKGPVPGGTPGSNGPTSPARAAAGTAPRAQSRPHHEHDLRCAENTVVPGPAKERTAGALLSLGLHCGLHRSKSRVISYHAGDLTIDHRRAALAGMPSHFLSDPGEDVTDGRRKPLAAPSRRDTPVIKSACDGPQ